MDLTKIYDPFRCHFNVFDYNILHILLLTHALSLYFFSSFAYYGMAFKGTFVNLMHFTRLTVYAGSYWCQAEVETWAAFSPLLSCIRFRVRCCVKNVICLVESNILHICNLNFKKIIHKFIIAKMLEKNQKNNIKKIS